MAIAHMTLLVRLTKKSSNQKQELPVVEMFVNRSELN
jgi:hypothetical protein